MALCVLSAATITGMPPASRMAPRFAAGRQIKQRPTRPLAHACGGLVRDEGGYDRGDAAGLADRVAIRRAERQDDQRTRLLTQVGGGVVRGERSHEAQECRRPHRSRAESPRCCALGSSSSHTQRRTCPSLAAALARRRRILLLYAPRPARAPTRSRCFCSRAPLSLPAPFSRAALSRASLLSHERPSRALPAPSSRAPSLARLPPSREQLSHEPRTFFSRSSLSRAAFHVPRTPSSRAPPSRALAPAFSAAATALRNRRRSTGFAAARPPPQVRARLRNLYEAELVETIGRLALRRS